MNNPVCFLKPTGSLIIGNTGDCNKGFLERCLKYYDQQLYIKWNPKKRGGWGMWEVRRRPETATNVFQGKLEDGTNVYTYEYKELDLVNHVLDVPVLHYNVLGKIKSMDA